MTEPTLGKVLDFPAPIIDPDDIQDDVPTTLAAHGAGDGGQDGPPPAVTATAPDDDGDDDGVRVLVDAPSGPEPGRFTTALATRHAHRRPIIASWLRDRDEFRDVSRWTAGHIGHTVAYHAVRVPTYAGRLSVRAPRGAVKVVTGLGAWCADAEAMPLRVAAVASTDADAYMKLTRMRDDRVRWRRIVVAAIAAGAVAGAALLLTAPGVVQVVALTVVVAVLGWYGSPADKPLLDVAVVVPRAQKLASEIVIRALSVLSIAGINKALASNKEGIAFPEPIERDGPGFRAVVDLPYGVTATDVIERGDRLASGLRRPLGCGVAEGRVRSEHAGADWCCGSAIRTCPSTRAASVAPREVREGGCVHRVRVRHRPAPPDRARQVDYYVHQLAVRCDSRHGQDLLPHASPLLYAALDPTAGGVGVRAEGHRRPGTPASEDHPRGAVRVRGGRSRHVLAET